MSISDESKAFHFSVYSVVNQIPKGHVVSYGHIAYLIGRPQNSRLVGSSLKHCTLLVEQLNQDLPSGEQINLEKLPWWRVVSSSGRISSRSNTEVEIEQARLLREEGVAVSQGNHVDISEYGWLPNDVDF